MKVKIELDKGESLEKAENDLLKALKKKERMSTEPKGEQYIDPMLNDFHDMIVDSHDQVLSDIKERITTEVNNLVSTRRYI